MFIKKVFFTLIVLFPSLLLSTLSYGQVLQLEQNTWQSIGRGHVEWNQSAVQIKDCFIAAKEATQSKAYEFTFKAKTLKKEEQVQIWAGFGFQDRDNRYAIGLRGGNNNDLYLCRYQSMAKSKMLALEPLDFKPVTGKLYQLRVQFSDGMIKVFLDDEQQPRIMVKDKTPLEGGAVVLGGGWLENEYKDVTIKSISAADFAQSGKEKHLVRLSKAEKESLRQQQRNTYQTVKVKRVKRGRTEISLNGNWLFLPEYELENQSPFALKTADKDWHIMRVPDFWNPAGNWLHLQDSKLPHRGSGISDNYRELEYDRARSYTFDFEKTNGAWYRQYLQLPKQIKGKKIKLHFDAVSKVADVYVNGKYVGGHVGMFGDFSFDITDFVQTGKNLIAVNVQVRKFEKTKDAEEHVTRAVSVDINNDMLNSLPHGMFTNTEGGIWQDVKLIITEDLAIDDVFAGVRSDGGDFDITLRNEGTETQEGQVEIEIIDKVSGQLLFKSKNKEKHSLSANSTKHIRIQTGKISPKTWSPDNPNLYMLKTKLRQNGRLIDEQQIDIGFRSFEVKNGQFYLNGNPYWLGGANHPPIGIRPRDKALASKFYGYMHANNQMVTRSHGCPFTRPWMQASDEQGVGVSYEGPFPWFMIGKMPSEELIKIWRDETLALVKKYRNHPSLLIWTINNEMYFTMFYHNDPPEIRLKKWKILSDLIKEIRKLSPNTVISADSGYSREEGDYKKNLEPHGIDDGDIDDRHIYLNWYNRDFYQVHNGEWAKRIYWSPGANPDRAFFSQETSTGYTNNDDGHFNRKYLFNNYVPQSWVGDWAYEDKDPAFTSKRHAFMSKELIETIRRTSPETAGLQLFANVTWYRNVYDAASIEPYPINFSVKKAYQPILVSAELFGRSFYAGTTIKPRVCIINNDFAAKDIAAATLEWKIVQDGKVLKTGSQKTAAIPYYKRVWMDLAVELPSSLPVDKANCQLVLTLKSNDKVLSENDYDILISQKNWLGINQNLTGKKIGVFDISGETYALLDFMGVKYQKLKDLTQIRILDLDLLIVANLDTDNEVPYSWEDVRKVMGNGLNTLLIHPGKHMQWLMYDKIQSIYERTGRVVNMHVPEHGAFNDLAPMELAWWQPLADERPRACRRSYRLKANSEMTELATYLRPHTGLGGVREETYYEMSGTPLIEVTERNGRLIASEMEVNRGVEDPVAAKLMSNLIIELLR
jgi:hypothetical protein